MIGGWRDQLTTLYNSLNYQDILQTTLVEIDKKIITGESIYSIMCLGYNRIKELTKSDHVVFLIGDDEIDLPINKGSINLVKKSGFNKKTIEIDSHQLSWETYIDSVDIIYKNNADEIVDNLINIEGVTSITRQLNIAILRDVERRVNNLYRIVIKRFSKLGDIYSVFDLFCDEITNIFPDLTETEVFNSEDVNAQVAIFESKEKSYESGGRLKGVGSTTGQQPGAYIDEKNSLTGRLFPMMNGNDLEQDFYVVRHEKNRYVYYLGDPSDNPYYRQISEDISKSQLSVPLFMQSSSGENFAFAVIILESTVKDKFKVIHAKSLLYNAGRLAELLNSVWRIAQGRKYIVEGFFSNKDLYIRNILNEHNHRTGHTLNSLSNIMYKLEHSSNNRSIEKDVIEAFDKLNRDKKILSDSLSTIVNNSEFVSLKEDIGKARFYIQKQLAQESIEFIVDIEEGIDQVALDNLFPQYLYSLFYNSIESIFSKKNRFRSLSMRSELTNYKPIIKITAKRYSMPKSVFDQKDKCKIVITDNGDGIEPDKLEHLGRYRKSFKGSSGTGLYSFKQYLLVHDSRVFFKSDYQDNFLVKFIVDMP